MAHFTDSATSHLKEVIAVLDDYMANWSGELGMGLCADARQKLTDALSALEHEEAEEYWRDQAQIDEKIAADERASVDGRAG